MPIVTFGGGLKRNRPIHLYFWDERDGGGWSGWWVTPDFPGNGEFILHAPSGTAHPADIPVGEWRSPLVEIDLNRELRLGFVTRTGSESLRAAGPDAATPMLPDGHTTYDFSRYIFEPAGLHHGKPAFVARDKTSEDKGEEGEQGGWRGLFAGAQLSPAVYAALGAAIGVAVTLLLANRRVGK